MRVASFERKTRFRLDSRFYIITEASLDEQGKPAWIARRDDQRAILFAEEVLLQRYAERELEFVVVSHDRPNAPVQPEVPPDVDEISPGDRARVTIRQAFLKVLPRKLREALVDDTPCSLRCGKAAAAIDDAWKEAKDAAQAKAVALLTQSEPGPLSRQFAKRLLAEAERTTPAPKTIMAWRRLDDPRNPGRLAGRLSNSGNRKQMPAWMHAIINLVVRAELDRLLAANPDVPRQGAIARTMVAADKAIKAHVAENSSDGHGKVSVSSQAIYRAWRSFDAYEVHLALHGPQSTKNAFRHTYGAERPDRVMAEVDYDETRSNLWVAHDDLRIILGKATIGICRDRATNGLAGYSLGFEPASISTFTATLRHALVPKIVVAHLYPETVHPWLPGGVMGCLNIDNSLQAWSDTALAICDELRIAGRFARVRTPIDKPWAEGFFSALEANLERLVPGYDRRRAENVDTYDPTVHQAVSLSALDRLFHQWVCDVRHQTHVPRLGASPDELFRRFTLEHPVRYPASLDELDRILGDECEATADHNGIWCQSILYRHSEVLALRMLKGARVRVRVKVPRHDLEHIYVQCPRSGAWDRIPAMDDFRLYTRGLTQHLHDLVRKSLKDDGNEREPGVRGLVKGLSSLVNAIEMLVVEAKQGRYQQRLGRVLGAEAPHNALLARLSSMERVRERGAQLQELPSRTGHVTVSEVPEDIPRLVGEPPVAPPVVTQPPRNAIAVTEFGDDLFS